MTQSEALTILKTGANVFLTGEPGSGKTHTLMSYISWLKKQGSEPAITASTGIAATHLSGQTIHSWSGIGARDYVSAFDIEVLGQKEYLVKRHRKAHTLIIDEISMLSASFFESLDKLLRETRHSQKPFGGLQVVLVGDFFQLPPVSKNNDALYAFMSSAWKDLNPLVCYLDEQHRQSDDMYLSLLKSIRSNDFDEDMYELLRERMNADEDTEDMTRLYTHNTDVDTENARKLDELPGKHKVFAMKSTGRSQHIDILKRGCTSPETLSLKEGAVVMFTRNNPTAGYVNGTTGIVSHFNQEGVPVITLSNNKTIAAHPLEWKYEEDGAVRATVEQVPLRLAWAITIHKSQGMTLEKAVIDLSRAFAHGQGYVALSRLTALSGLLLTGFHQQALSVNPEVQKFDKHCMELSDATTEYFFKTMSEKDVGALQKAFQSSLTSVKSKAVKK